MEALISDSRDGNCPSPPALSAIRGYSCPIFCRKSLRDREAAARPTISRKPCGSSAAPISAARRWGRISMTPPNGRFPLTPMSSRHSVVSASRACACGSQSAGSIASARSLPSEQAVCATSCVRIASNSRTRSACVSMSIGKLYPHKRGERNVWSGFNS